MSLSRVLQRGQGGLLAAFAAMLAATATAVPASVDEVVMPQAETYGAMRPLLDDLLIESDATAQGMWFDGPTKLVTETKTGQRLTWDLATHAEVSRKKHPANTLAASPDGRFVVTTSDSDQGLFLKDTARLGKESLLPGSQGATKRDRTQFSRDGSLVVTDERLENLLVWETVSGSKLAELHLDASRKSFGLSPDNKHVAIVSGDEVHIIDFRTSSPVVALKQPDAQLFSFNGDGKLLAVATADAVIHVWDVERRVERATLSGHSLTASSMLFSADASLLISGSDDKTVRIWDISTGKERARLSPEQRVSLVALSPDGRTIAAGTDVDVTLWDLASGKSVGRVLGGMPLVFAVAFSRDGRIAASGGTDSLVHLWDLSTGRELSRLGGHVGDIRSIAFSPDGKNLSTDAYDNVVRSWEVSTGQPTGAPVKFEDDIGNLAYSPDGRVLAVFSKAGVHLIQVRQDGRLDSEGKPPRTLANPSSNADGVAFSPDGKLLASGADADGAVVIWEVATGRKLGNLKDTPGNERRPSSFWSVQFSHDGRSVAAGSENGRVRIWDVATHALRTYPELYKGGVPALDFSPDDKTLLIGSHDGSVRLWDIEGRREIAKFSLSRGDGVISAQYSLDGKAIVAGSRDGTTRILDAVTLQESGIFVSDSNGNWAGCLAARQTCRRADDGTFVGSLDERGLRRPLIPPGQAQRLAVKRADAASVPADIAASAAVATIDYNVRNLGSESAHWLHIVPAPGSDNAGVAVESPLLQSLDPGQERQVTVRLHVHAPTMNPSASRVKLALALSQARGDPLPLDPVQIDVTPPSLQVVGARLQREGDGQQTLAIGLRNNGSRLGQTLFHVTVPGLDKPAEFTLAQLLPGQTSTLAVSLGALYKASRSMKILLEGQTQREGNQVGLPMYDFRFPDTSVTMPGWPWFLYVAVAALLLGLAGLARYQQVYRHPTVVRLTSDPSSLRQLPLETLAFAKDALARARRLDALLRETHVAPAWLEGAIQFARPGASTRRAQSLANRLGLELGSAGTKDGSTWILPLSEDFPLNLARLRLHVPDERESAADIFNALGNAAEVTLVIGSTPDQRSDLSSRAKSRGGLLVAPDSFESTQLFLADNPQDELARLISRYVPLTQISPYQTGAGVQRQSLFFGRKALIAQITGRDPTNYLVVGGRQVGKSSLLKELERRYRQDASVECHYLVLTGDDGGAALAAALDLPRGARFDDALDEIARRDGRRIVFLVDEADAFVEADWRRGYPALQRLRKLSEEGRAHFILAGFWALYRQAVLDYQSPLKNFGTVLTVGALEVDACRALAVEPMQTLGISWETQALVDELVARTGQRANLISIGCEAALNSLGRTERLLGRHHLDEALQHPNMRNQLAGWSDLGNDAAESRMDRIVVYATIGVGDFDLVELLEKLKSLGHAVEPEKLRGSLARLELAFVLRREGSRYTYAVPLLREFIRSDDTDYLLREELQSQA